jgi:5-methylcytosine-specific restriction protein A
VHVVTRSVPEWIGKSDDSPVPPRVRVRVFERYHGRCQCGCNRLIRTGERWDCEDTIAIINGGERRESNLKPWLTEHHKGKTAKDVAEKATVYRKKAKHLGIRKPSRFACSRDSRFKKKISGEVVAR